MDIRQEERQGLVDAVSFVPMIRSFRNVDVVGKADWMTYLGSPNVVITQCNYAIKLKLDSGWSWFITLSACDYPLITHDDEIDAIGGRPFSEGTNAYHEIQRTLTELFNQLDGFDQLGKGFNGADLLNACTEDEMSPKCNVNLETDGLCA
ncbi:hypothetical protein KIW84_053801 [Lathyrus oleraceus]|uniref:Uncharacterized protein n=1 Tax=Pisum sativum TaxID=3888 RepID=A0A9D4WSK8_PEA|nr:hypothetical protein KIW84_053801 [Pisum sativum]